MAAESEWPEVEVTVRVGHVAAPQRSLGDDAAVFPLLGGGQVAITRRPRRGDYVVPSPLTVDSIAHPYLVPVAAVHSHWLTRSAFHAGGFVFQGGAWGVVGGRRGGKSTFLAGVAERGLDVLADDLLVIDDGAAFVGPRTLDLREDAGSRFPGARDLGVVGARPRWRLDLPPVPPSTPLAGWLFLEWGDHPEVHRVGVTDRLRALAPSRTLKGARGDASQLLHLARLPAFAVRQIRRWDAAPGLLSVVLEQLAHR